MRADPHVARGGERELHLLDRPFLPGLGIAPDLGRGEAVEGRVVDGVDGDKLALQMGRKLGHLDPVLGGAALEVIAIVLGRRGLRQVDQPGIPAGHLHARVAALGRPFGDRVPGVERRFVACELRQKQRRALYGFHLCLLPVRRSG